MSLKLTKILLEKLNSGELQNLAVEILSRENKEWSKISHSGIVEGTHQTRKGIPDAWCKTNDGNSVYIQATGDKAKGKMLGDLKKSIGVLNSLNENEGAVCVAFLNYEPQPVEISQCNTMCRENGCQFIYYTNGMISDLLDKKYQDLKSSYFGVNISQSQQTVQKKSFSRTKQVGEPSQTAERFINTLEWHNLTAKEYAENLSDINSLYNILKKINKTSLEFYSTLIELSEPNDNLEVPASEVENELNIEPREISNQMIILDKYGLGYIDDGEFPVMLGVTAGEVSWSLLACIKEYSEKTGIPLSDIIVDLKFSLLD